MDVALKIPLYEEELAIACIAFSKCIAHLLCLTSGCSIERSQINTLSLFGLLLAIDPILDMARTATNVAGQALVPTIVAKRNGILDEDVYNGRVSTGSATEPALV